MIESAYSCCGGRSVPQSTNGLITTDLAITGRRSGSWLLPRRACRTASWLPAETVRYHSSSAPQRAAAHWRRSGERAWRVPCALHVHYGSRGVDGCSRGWGRGPGAPCGLPGPVAKPSLNASSGSEVVDCHASLTARLFKAICLRCEDSGGRQLAWDGSWGIPGQGGGGMTIAFAVRPRIPMSPSALRSLPE
jgi:hypothetical protein